MSESKIWENRYPIFVLALIFMPMGFLVGIYLITHKDKEYNEIGETIIRLIIYIPLCIILLMIFFVNYSYN